MKKVLMVLGLAMCASMAFAQSSNYVPKKISPNDADRVAFTNVKSDASIDYKASIFTKDDDQVVATFDFAAGNMTGITYGQSAVVSANDPVLGDAHDLVTSASVWMRVDSTGFVGTQTFATNYPMSADFGAARIPLYLGEQNDILEDNGFMFIPEIDAAPLVSGTTEGCMNAYFALPAVTIPSNSNMVDVDFRQFYRKFYEHTYIDYKINGAWQTVEVNVSGVDVSVNGTGAAHVVANLPHAAALQGNLEVRFRAFSKGSHQIFGYMWAVDDVKIIAVSTPARWRFSNVGYLEGFYGLIPEGFQLPLSYAAYGRNTSITNLSNIQLNMSFRYDDEGTWVNNDAYDFSVNQSNMPAGDVNQKFLFKINERGFMVDSLGFSQRTTTINGTEMDEYYAQSAAELWQNYGYPADSMSSSWQLRSLPTNHVGKNQFIINATSAEIASPAVFDTMTYTVSDWIEEDASRGITVPGYRWGHDNGVIAGGSEYAYQFTDPEYAGGPVYVTSEGSHQYGNEYEVYTRFVTPSDIPVDANGEPWVIRGIELIPSTTLNAASLNGVRISPVSYFEMMGDDGEFHTYYYNNYTGLDQSATVSINGNAAANPNGEEGYFLADEEYHAVNILFPGQPVLAPNMSFFFGYKLPQGGTFALGSQQSYFNVNADSSAYYSEDPVLKDYANQFNPRNKVYDVITYDGEAGRSVSGRNITIYPLIRLIVGPRMEIPEMHVSSTCDSVGSYWIYRAGNRCVYGTDTVAQGSTFGYEIIPGIPDENSDDFDPYTNVDEDGDYAGWVIEKIYLDGVEVPLTDSRIVEEDYNLTDPNHENWEPLLLRKSYTLYLEDIQADHHISAVAGLRKLGVEKPYDANINLGLSPNPATSQVRLNISGVTGKVNCSILDMSGRVVYTSDFNAENAQVINLNSVPAGAYFVRVTGESFSKVERLIVR